MGCVTDFERGKSVVQIGEYISSACYVGFYGLVCTLYSAEVVVAPVASSPQLLLYRMLLSMQTRNSYIIT
jgi:hypothetical protein